MPTFPDVGALAFSRLSDALVDSAADQACHEAAAASWAEPLPPGLASIVRPQQQTAARPKRHRSVQAQAARKKHRNDRRKAASSAPTATLASGAAPTADFTTSDSATNPVPTSAAATATSSSALSVASTGARHIFTTAEVVSALAATHSGPDLTRSSAQTTTATSPLASASAAASASAPATGGNRGAVLLKRLAEAQRTAKQARALVKLARKQATRGARIAFARGVQAERGVSKAAQKSRAKRRSKADRKGQEAVRRRKKARRKKVAAVPPPAPALRLPPPPQQNTWRRIQRRRTQ